MRFDEVEVILRYKGKLVDHYKNSILCGKVLNQKRDIVNENLENVVALLDGATEFNDSYGVWKKKLFPKRRVWRPKH